MTPSKEQEAQQAQTIADIRQWLNNVMSDGTGKLHGWDERRALRDIWRLIYHGESQARKISELTETVDSEKTSKELAQSELQKSLQKIAELTEELKQVSALLKAEHDHNAELEKVGK